MYIFLLFSYVYLFILLFIILFLFLFLIFFFSLILLIFFFMTPFFPFFFLCLLPPSSCHIQFSISSFLLHLSSSLLRPHLLSFFSPLITILCFFFSFTFIQESPECLFFHLSSNFFHSFLAYYFSLSLIFSLFLRFQLLFSFPLTFLIYIFLFLFALFLLSKKFIKKKLKPVIT